MLPELIKVQRGSWYDVGDKEVRHGCVYTYRVSSIDVLKDNKIGEWMLSVFIDRWKTKAFVKATLSEDSSLLANEIKTKAVVFKQASPENLNYYNYFYHLVSYIKLKGARLSRERVSSENEIPLYIRNDDYLKKSNKVKFEKYKEVIKGKKQFSDKIVVLIEKDSSCLLAYYYFLEVIVGAYFNSEQSTLDLLDYQCNASNCF
ncbi:MAG: hypothetical protein ACP5LF_05345 [Nitrososphaeria archaeon]|nr:hypothetical protein [Conexivisphaerales archaeon]